MRGEIILNGFLKTLMSKKWSSMPRLQKHVLRVAIIGSEVVIC